MKLVAPETMLRLDRESAAAGGPATPELMERAGRAAFEAICRRFASEWAGRVALLCGPGNNGGDGFVVARHLVSAGARSVRPLLVGRRDQVRGDAARALAALEAAAPGLLAEAPDEAALVAALPPAVDLAVDALFGTGLARPLEGVHRRAVEWLNGCGAPVVALDLPSGVHAGTGAVLGVAVRARLTVTFGLAKLGLALDPGASLAGRVEVVDIGHPRALLDAAPGDRLLDRDEVAPALARLLPRDPAGHKGTYGHVLVVAGAQGTAGAAALAALGALRAGAGLVTVAAPASLRPALETKLWEAMVRPLPEGPDGALDASALPLLVELAAARDAVVLGPGLTTRPGAVTVVRELARRVERPLLLDADGLNALGGAEGLAALKGAAGPRVLTPHPGEMGRLLGRTTREVEADRPAAAREAARLSGAIALLKGHRTLVARPDGALAVNSTGNPAMASGGMGDVLSGVIGALLGQGLDAASAAELGAYLHGAAGDLGAEEVGPAGLLATDLAGRLPRVLAALAPKAA
ncbi:MAG TPA: NAD(P)H-hydrate dehydratase [Thermodesulfobacteriota bacterium]